MKKSRSFYGLGIQAAGLMEACAVSRRFPMQNLSLQLAPGFKQVCRVRTIGDPSMSKYQLTINGQRKQVDVDPSTPLLWVLREELKMTGTKYGCGISMCGACTVHLDGVATRSCIVPISLVGDRSIVTIEGIGSDPIGRAVQEAWVDKDVYRRVSRHSEYSFAAWAIGPHSRRRGMHRVADPPEAKLRERRPLKLQESRSLQASVCLVCRRVRSIVRD
jgi:hypothetical protein